jgi:hypothetical protein
MGPSVYPDVTDVWPTRATKMSAAICPAAI